MGYIPSFRPYHIPVQYQLTTDKSGQYYQTVRTRYHVQLGEPNRMTQQTKAERDAELLQQATISIRETAGIIGCSVNKAYEAADRGDIETFTIGRLRRVPTAPLR